MSQQILMHLALVLNSGKRFTPSIPTGLSSPTWVGQAQPHFNAAPHATGSTVTIDTATALNAPTSYLVQFYRDGNAIPGAVTTSYVTTSSDTETMLSATIIAQNSAGNSETVSIPGTLIS